jgi:hypothetical protein
MANEIVCGQGGVVIVAAAITKVKSWSIRYRSDVRDGTTMESGGWRERKACLKEWEGEFAVITYPGALVGTIAVGSFVNTSETGSKIYTGSVAVQEHSVNPDFEGIVEWRCTFLGHGSLAIN